MRTTLLLIVAAMVAGCAKDSATREGGYPSTTISNGTTTMSLYLPDAKEGYYRGVRFDWSGMISRINYKGHVFYAPWKETHDPAFHEDVIGPAGEFGMPAPLGFAEAKPGETFIKIGIGHLRKTADTQHRFDSVYEIVRAAPWKVESGKDWIEFRQSVTDERGWGYEYVKRIELLKDKGGFAMSHRLKNTGTRAIDTTYYNHNFTMIDDRPIGKGYRLVYAFELRPIERRLEAPGEFRGKELTFTGEMRPGQALWVAFDGFKTAADNAVTIRNDTTGAAIRIIGDETPIRCVYYGTRLAACPEMFIPVKLAPGEEKKWTIRYELEVDGGR